MDEDELRFWDSFDKSIVSPKIRYKVKNPGYQKEYVQKLRAEVLTHYGNGKLACIRCGYADVRALCLDHINGGGRAERKTKSNPSIMLRIKREGYPDGYQTLCANCNMIKVNENGEREAWNRSN